MDYIFKQRIITIRNISPYLTMQEIQKENLKDFVIHKLIKDGSTFHIYLDHANGDLAVRKLEKDMKALPMRLNSVNMKLHSNILCVTGITSSLNEEILQEVLQGFGEVLLPFKLITSKKTNQSKGYGWLVYKDIKSAEKCMWMIPKLELQPQALRAGWAGNNITCEDDLFSVSTIYVQGIPSSIQTVKDLKQFFSKNNDEISFCQLMASDDSPSPKICAILEFKSSEAAERCVLENNTAKVIDGVLRLTYAFPGYSGVDLVFNNKPVEIQAKRSQASNRSLQHPNQCSVPVYPRCSAVGYVRPLMSVQMTPVYQNTLGQVPSPYVPMSDIIRPQLIGVRPFVYNPLGIHNVQDARYVSQQFSYPRQYPLKGEQPHQQTIEHQPTTNGYKPTMPILHNHRLPKHLQDQLEVSKDINQQTLSGNGLNCRSVAEQQQLEFEQGMNCNPFLKEGESGFVQQQQFTKQQKQRPIERSKSQNVRCSGEELSQKQLEELTVNYLQEQQREKQQQRERQQQQEQLLQQQRMQHEQQQRQPLPKKQQQKQQKRKQQLKQKEQQERQQEEQKVQLRQENQQQMLQKQQLEEIDVRAKEPNQEAYNETDKLNFPCLQNYKRQLLQSKRLATVLTHLMRRNGSACKSLVNPDLRDKDNNEVRQNDIVKGFEISKQRTDEAISKISDVNDTKIGDSGISMKQRVTNEQQVVQTKTVDSAGKETKVPDKLTKSILHQWRPLQSTKEQQEDSRKNESEKKLQLTPKEKLFLLQQQIKRQAEALERLSQNHERLGIEKERNETEKDGIPVKTFSGAAAGLSVERKTSEKVRIEAQNDACLASEVKALKKRDSLTHLSPTTNVASRYSLKLNDKEERSPPPRSSSKIRLAQRADIHDDSETKEKRPRLDKDEPLSKFSEALPSSNVLQNTVTKITDLTQTNSIAGPKNGATDALVGASTSLKVKTKPDQPNQRLKSTTLSTPDDESSNLCSLLHQMNLNDELPSTTATKDELKPIMIITTTSTQKATNTDQKPITTVSTPTTKAPKDGVKTITTPTTKCNTVVTTLTPMTTTSKTTKSLQKPVASPARTVISTKTTKCEPRSVKAMTSTLASVEKAEMKPITTVVTKPVSATKVGKGEGLKSRSTIATKSATTVTKPAAKGLLKPIKYATTTSTPTKKATKGVARQLQTGNTTMLTPTVEEIKGDMKPTAIVTTTLTSTATASKKECVKAVLKPVTIITTASISTPMPPPPTDTKTRKDMLQSKMTVTIKATTDKLEPLTNVMRMPIPSKTTNATKEVVNPKAAAVTTSTATETLCVSKQITTVETTSTSVAKGMKDLLKPTSIIATRASTTTTPTEKEAAKVQLKLITTAPILTKTQAPRSELESLTNGYGERKCMTNLCKEFDCAKDIVAEPAASRPNETESVKDQVPEQFKHQEINCQSLEQHNTIVVVHENMKENLVVASNITAEKEKKKSPKSSGQGKQKSTPVVVVNSKAVNILTNVKKSERNFKVELAPTFNPTGIVRPIPKLPLQPIAPNEVVPEFSPVFTPSQFPRLYPPLHPQVNNIQQLQTYTNNQFQPIVGPEPCMGRKVNFLFNHPVLSPMPPAHFLNQNDTFTTNSHYDPVMVPNPLFMGMPGMQGHASHHIARPIPHLPTQHWQSMPIPPMMHPRMTYFPPVYPPVLPNISVNRNAPEFLSKLPDRQPRIQPDGTTFVLPYNNWSTMQMKLAPGRNMNDESQSHMPTFKVEAIHAAPFPNDFPSHGQAFDPCSQDIHVCDAVNPANFTSSEEIPYIHPTSSQPVDNVPYIPPKGVPHEQLAWEQGNSVKCEGQMNTTQALADKMEKTYQCTKQPVSKPEGTFKQSAKVPIFNRSVRELISVPFSSDESRLLYLLKRKQQGHPIAQEWWLVGNGLLTSHFRKLWDPPCDNENLLSNFDKVNPDCVCKRAPDTLKCYGCSKQFFGRVRYHCEIHPYRQFLTDLKFCPYCGIDLIWTEEPW